MESLLNNNQTMNEDEIKQVLDLLKLGIKRGKIEYTHLNPLTDNCYISSSGCFEGLYFPNSEISFTAHGKYLKFECIAKINFKLCAVFEWQSSKLNNGWHTETLESLVKTYEEMKIEQALKRDIHYMNERLRNLSYFKRVKTASGKDYKILAQNFPSANLVTYSDGDGNETSFHIANEGTIYRQNHKGRFTADEIEKAVIETVQDYKDTAKGYENALKKVASRYTQFEKRVKAVQEWLNTLTEQERQTYRQAIKDAI